ncbi:MAG: hypothetical protein H6741_22985 [Alphaproteobacteria bacterium]|nr:hypothetical protein [Alphaproteobacteria bacterium]
MSAKEPDIFDPSDLHRLMAEEGVTRRGEAPRAKRAAEAAGRPATPTPEPRSAPVDPRAMQVREAELAGARQKIEVQDQELRALRAQLAEREAALRRAEAEGRAARAQAEALQAALGAKEAESVSLRAQGQRAASELGGLRGALERATQAAAAAEAAREAMAREAEGLIDELPVLAELGALLDAVTLDPEEQVQVLSGLVAAELYALRGLQLAPAPVLGGLLQERVSLSCGAPSCAPKDGSVHLQVPPERCEVCGGSDIAQAFRTLLQACAGKQAPFRLMLVGGSPNYRTQLRHLAEGHSAALHLDLLGGRARPRTRRVRERVRQADLVVIWGATIMDHATSNAVIAAGGERLDVPHRGIVTMLRAVARHLSGR